MNKYLKILFPIPLILGVVGFAAAGESIVDSAFLSIGLYLLNYTDPTPNILIEIARWIAPVMTASGIITALAGASRAVRNWYRNKRGGSIAVYGEGEEAELIRMQLGKKLIIPESIEFVRASRYVLFDAENQNLAFYAQHKEALEDKPVCMKCSNIRSQDLKGNYLKAFNSEETAARLLWRQCGIYTLAKTHDYKLSISIIGFGKLGQEILLKGLQDNIFHPQQQLEYHVFGESAAFQTMHSQLAHMEDTIIFHDSWLNGTDVIRESDLIIISEQEEQLALIRDLLFVFNQKELHVLSSGVDTLDSLEAKERLRIYNWKKDVLSLDNLFADTLYARAKQINLRYAHLYGGIEETEENADLEWKKLDAFTKYSNISAADYHEVRLEMMKDRGIGQQPTTEQLEELSVLEHIRWCRYHYLNNWTYGVPANGKAKDALNRIHTDLLPYGELSEADKEKDRENIRVLITIN